MAQETFSFLKERFFRGNSPSLHTTNNSKGLASLFWASIFHNLNTECLWSWQVKCPQRKGAAVGTAWLLSRDKGRAEGGEGQKGHGCEASRETTPLKGSSSLLALRLGSWSCAPFCVQRRQADFSDLDRGFSFLQKRVLPVSWGGIL